MLATADYLSVAVGSSDIGGFAGNTTAGAICPLDAGGVYPLMLITQLYDCSIAEQQVAIALFAVNTLITPAACLPFLGSS